MREKSTDELEKILKTTKPGEIKSYFDANRNSIADAKRSFYYYMKDMVEAKNMKLKDVYIRAGVDEGWGGKIVRMERHTKNRDLIIGICLGAHFTLNEINTALKLYDMKPLYARDKRDAVILVAVNNRVYDISDIDDLLDKQGLEKMKMYSNE